MAFTPMSVGQGYPAIGAVVSDNAYTDVVPLGTIITAVDPDYGAGEFIYLKGAASTVRGSWVHYSADDFSTALAVADAVGPVAVAMGATVANTKGWYQISGKAVGRVLAGFLDNATPYLTSTPGSLDDTVVAGDYVHNAKGASAVGTPDANLAEFEISRPWTDNDIDDLDVS